MCCAWSVSQAADSLPTDIDALRAVALNAIAMKFSLSAEFIKGYIVTALDRSFASRDGAEFGGRRNLFRDAPTRGVGAESLTHEHGSSAMLGAHGCFNPVRHLWRERNSDSLTRSHRNLRLPCKTFS